ncbi:MAG: MerR family transcriptional regulator [Elusimicrobiota bacterium]
MGAARPFIPDKDYFSINEACRILQVPAHTLRYWEKQFTPLRPMRLDGGHRRYRRHDLETAFQIKDLLRNKKVTVAGARKALSGRQRGGRLPTGTGGKLPPAAVKMLRQVRDDLERTVSELSR